MMRIMLAILAAFLKEVFSSSVCSTQSASGRWTGIIGVGLPFGKQRG